VVFPSIGRLRPTPFRALENGRLQRKDAKKKQRTQSIRAASAPFVLPLRLCVIPSLGKWNSAAAQTGSEKPPRSTRSTRKRNCTEANEGNEATFCCGRGFPAPRKKQKKATDDTEKEKIHPQLSPLTRVASFFRVIRMIRGRFQFGKQESRNGIAQQATKCGQKKGGQKTGNKAAASRPFSVGLFFCPLPSCAMIL